MRNWAGGAVLAFAVVSTAEAQVSGFISANAAAQWPATRGVAQTGRGSLRQEVATLSSDQAFGAAPIYDLGVGVLRVLGGRWKVGVGVAFSRHHDAQPATVTVTLPHPIVFNRPSTASATSDEALARRELATHLQAIVESSIGQVTVRLSAGPSHIRLAQELVSDVIAGETLVLSPALPYTVSIIDIQSREGTGSAWGYHVAADVGVFLTRHIGVGGMARYSRASVDVPNALQNTIDGNGTAASRTSVGGVSVGAGLRVRF